MNKLCLIGNVTRDAELRATPNGVQVCSFSIAVNSQYRSRNQNSSDGQQRQEDTIFVRVSIWRERGVALANYIKKGTKVYVEGPIQQPRVWKDKTGADRADIQMNCDYFEFCSSRNDSSASSDSFQPEQDMPKQDNKGFETVDDAGDNLPF